MLLHHTHSRDTQRQSEAEAEKDKLRRRHKHKNTRAHTHTHTPRQAGRGVLRQCQPCCHQTARLDRLSHLLGLPEREAAKLAQALDAPPATTTIPCHGNLAKPPRSTTSNIMRIPPSWGHLDRRFALPRRRAVTLCLSTVGLEAVFCLSCYSSNVGKT